MGLIFGGADPLAIPKILTRHSRRLSPLDDPLGNVKLMNDLIV